MDTSIGIYQTGIHGPILPISNELRDRFTIILSSVLMLSSMADAVIVRRIMHL